MVKDNFNVSVVIPTFNRDVSLIRAIDSVNDQTLTANEIIVVDDCSNFPVSELLENYNMIKVIRNYKNLGASQSRNIGVNHSIFNYVAFLDSDDSWHPNKLEKQIEIASEHPDVSIIYCAQYVVDRFNNILEFEKKLIDKDIWINLVYGWTAPNTSTILLKKCIFKKLGGFDPELTSCQDHDLWMKIAIRNEKVKYSSERLAYFHMGEYNRISFDYYNRLNGASLFLDKWKGTIVTKHGLSHYNWFKRDYFSKVSLPIFNFSLSQFQFKKATLIYLKYLFYYPQFYRSLLNNIKKLLFK